MKHAWKSYRSCFDVFDDTIERRATRLLLILMLARMDGKSPVEYIVDEAQKELVRRVVYDLLPADIFTLGEVCSRWQQHLAVRG